jgi:aspartate/methionine/tyrosine aminotransferase
MKQPYFPHNPHLKQSVLRQIFESAPAGSINLGIGQPGEDTPDFIKEAAARALRECNLGYTLNAGILPLREKLAAELGSSITASNICLTAGVQEGLFALFKVLLDPGADFLLPNPGFMTYPALAALNDVRPRYYSLSAENNFRFNAEAVLSELKPDTRAVLLAHPSNPTGSIAEEHEIRKLLEGIANRPEGPVWVISDEVYYGMSYLPSASLQDFIEEFPFVILLRGASKSHHMTGWRLGWTVLPDVLVKPYVAAHQYITTCVSALTQHTFNLIRGTKEEAEWFIEQQSLYKKKRDIVYETLHHLRPLLGGEGAFYWMLQLNTDDLNGQTDMDWVLNLLQAHKVITVPGSAFGSMADGFVRISYGAPIDQLPKGLDRIRRALGQ